MNNQWIRIFSISGAYIALLIGGAFSTGQEAMQFFVGFGSKGLIGLLICGFLMIIPASHCLKLENKMIFVLTRMLSGIFAVVILVFL